MAYASQQNMIDRFGNEEIISITNPEGESIGTDRLNRALSDADARIDGYLAARYALPLEITPTLLEGVACDLSRYFLYDEAPSEIVVERYKNAVSTLKDISTGKIKLPDAAGDEPSQSSEVVMADHPDRMFSVNSLRGL
ncbi:MAG: DUF1320 domain-containing protein [Alphaproteobacteria bacterium]|nr:DUF1320 domain-containing protein [Alphaproteobacteria bacterium]